MVSGDVFHLCSFFIVEVIKKYIKYSAFRLRYLKKVSGKYVSLMDFTGERIWGRAVNDGHLYVLS